MNGIRTYPEMNEIIKDLLGHHDEPFMQYVLARIEDLEQENDELRKSVKESEMA